MVESPGAAGVAIVARAVLGLQRPAAPAGAAAGPVQVASGLKLAIASWGEAASVARSSVGEAPSTTSRRRRAAVCRLLLVFLVLAACGGVEPSPSSSTGPAGWPSCDGEGWSVRYPSEWFAHPADPARGLDACALFAQEPFEAEPEDDGGWSGAHVVLGLEAGCRGSFEVSTSEEELEIEGFPAWRRSLRDGHSDGGPATAYEYFINLSPHAACEAGQWFYSRTEADDPGDFAENRAVLDQMMATLSLQEAE